MSELRQCNKCKEYSDNRTFRAVYDRYGIYFGKVCESCHDKAESEAKKWIFDPDDAGETLGDYSDDY